MSDEMIGLDASDANIGFQEISVGKENVSSEITTRCALGLFFGLLVGVMAALYCLAADGTGGVAWFVWFFLLSSGTVLGGIYGGSGAESNRQKALETPDGAKQIGKLLAERNKMDERICELGGKRDQLDRELAALTSDDFVEEFVRDRPFPLALAPTSPPTSPDVSPESDFVNRYHDSDCA